MVRMKLLYFVVQFFGISKLETCKMVVLSLNVEKKTNHQWLDEWQQHMPYPCLRCSWQKDSWFCVKTGGFGGTHSSLWVLGRLSCALREHSRDSWVVLGLSWFGSSKQIFFGRPKKRSLQTPHWFLQLHVEFATLFSMSLLSWLFQSKID